MILKNIYIIIQKKGRRQNKDSCNKSCPRGKSWVV